MNHARCSRLWTIALAVALLVAPTARAKPKGPDPRTPVVDDFEITILADAIPGRSTMGEWGFSALVEVTSGGITKRFLFDTGDKPETVLANARKLGLETVLCNVEDVVLSHNHADHTGGLLRLREACAAINPLALTKAHVGGEEIFWPRIGADGQKNPMVAKAPLYEQAGGTFVVDPQPHQFLLPGVFLTGHIARLYDEKTYLPATPMQLQKPTGELVEDLVPEDQALVINTPAGVVVLTGCAHAGTINTLEQGKTIVGGAPEFVLAGGLHWFQMEDGDKHEVATVDWEANEMKRLDVTAMLGGHCTGFERFFHIRDILKLDWSQASLAAVGTVLALDPRFTFTEPQALNVPMGTDK